MPFASRIVGYVLGSAVAFGVLVRSAQAESPAEGTVADAAVAEDAGANAVTALWAAVRATGGDARAFAGVQLAAIGAATAGLARSHARAVAAMETSWARPIRSRTSMICSPCGVA